MKKVYSAQNFAAYIIYELNETNTFVNAKALQHLLAVVKQRWESVFGYSPYREKTYSLLTHGYVVKEVHDEYKEYGERLITEPAKEWYLKYGDFQLIRRPYAVPAFSTEEEQLMRKILNQYRNGLWMNAS
ncbi:hypothetical protein NST62_00400 [Ureibacillus sp. FSL K6-8385]|uniref:Uncharacterized protein n=1 Tax=Ureibacillus terrenus TaxID=118246 RepID=A0A540V593_9BACL|nr:hypothetical protein [Ureibacillus terrenus]MED3661124.1 hypothetical protein [Ureibacillus terrenus]MED3764398.1 hypothetical protein [Ureibacillus terrenus]TQE91930.1 hypothetical protein FKZ59_02220 [Ureibacillus terrenus]